MRCNDAGNILSMAKEAGLGNSAFGALEIDADLPVLYCWGLLMRRLHFSTKLNERSSLYIGLSRADTRPDREMCHGDENGPNYYAYHSRKWVMRQSGGSLFLQPKRSNREYGDGYEQGDVLSIELRGKDETLRFYKNGTDEGIAFDDVESGTYHMAVSMFGCSDMPSPEQVELLRFEQTTIFD